MSGLRGLVEKATPGPWEFDGFEHVVSLEVADIVCGLWQGLRAEGVPTPDMEADAALIALAPDLALWAADAAAARTYSFSARSWMAAKRASRCGKTERY